MQSVILSQIHGLRHDFGNMKRPVDLERFPNWETSRPRWKQVHGTQWTEVTHSQQDCGEVDALWTQTPGLPIGIITADCVPIILCKNDASKVAVIHAGWRGTLNKIIQKLWSNFETFHHEQAGHWSAAIGPCISGNSYPVSEELTRDFEKEFPLIPKHILSPQPYHLDLGAIHKFNLKNMGFSAVDRIDQCTLSSKKDGEYEFQSYRRDGKTSGRQYTIAMIL